MPTIGQKLGETRIERGLSVDDVAHATRIHPSMVARIEADDFSQFPSVAYAKSFVRKYADLLELDLDGAMDALNAGLIRLEDNELLGEMKKASSRARRWRWNPFRRSRRMEKAGGAPLFLNFVLVSLIAALGIFYFLGYNAPSLDDAKRDIAKGLGLPEPQPQEESPTLEPNPLNANRRTAPTETTAANPNATPGVPTARRRLPEKLAAPPVTTSPQVTPSGPETPAADPNSPLPTAPQAPGPAESPNPETPALRAVPVAASERGGERP